MKKIGQNKFQEWLDKTSYSDVRFFPENAGASSSSEILGSAYAAVMAHENGKTIPYRDDVVESFIKEETEEAHC